MIVFLVFGPARESQAKARRAQQADAAYSALWDIREWLRARDKYDAIPGAEKDRERFAEILDATGVDLDDYS